MYAVATHEIARDLHGLLRALEPTRWRPEHTEELRTGLKEVRERLDQVLCDWDPSDALSEVAHDLANALSGLPDGDVRETWMNFRDSVTPMYGALADALKACHLELPDLRPSNWRRSVAHAGSGLVSLAILEAFPFLWVEVIAIGFAIGCWSVELLRGVSEEWNARMMRLFSKIAHPHEAYRVNSSTWYATALVVLVLATESPVICAISVMILAFGDPIAAIVGRRFGKHELINNRSLEGTAAFFVAGALVSVATIALFHSGDVTVTQWIAVSLAAAFVGAITELLSRRIDDNFSIPVMSAAAAWLVFLIV